MDSLLDELEEDEATESDEDNPFQETTGESTTETTTQTTTQTTPRAPAGEQTGNLSEEELAEIVDDLQTHVTVVGCGGAGSNTLTRMQEKGIHGAEFVALNTDAQHLLKETESDEKILIGRETAGGRGAGSVPKTGETAALENEAEIEAAVEGSDMVFVTAGLGGGTGTGSAPVVARKAKEADALTVAVVTLPFTAEGDQRRVNAEAGLQSLRKEADTVIVIENDRLLEYAPNLSLQKAFEFCDEVLAKSVKGITETITRSGMVNLDFADVRTVMENGGVAMIGLGESDTEAKAQDSVSKALSSPLLDVDVSNADAALVNVTGGPDMTIDEAEGAVENLYDRVDPDARIIWGAGVDEEAEGRMETLLVVTGVDSDQIYGEPEDETTTETEEEDEGSIDFVA